MSTHLVIEVHGPAKGDNKFGANILEKNCDCLRHETDDFTSSRFSTLHKVQTRPSMSPPVSPLYRIETISNAGRGVLSSSSSTAGAVLLCSSSPASHVIFREYRKEVCACCFFYDRSRALPVRHESTGKVFCSAECQAEWLEASGELSVAAWEALHTFVQNRGKATISKDSQSVCDEKPTKDEIDRSWLEAEAYLKHQRGKNNGSVTASKAFTKSEKTRHRQIKAAVDKFIDPDILSYLLSSILRHHTNPSQWETDIPTLALDSTPYSSSTDLRAHTLGLIQLAVILPASLLSSVNAHVCHTSIAAASHNSFGIRAGGSDNEEYMGYGLWPAASYFNHSCAPNVAKKRVGTAWEFTVAGMVANGEELCITYLGGDERDLDVQARRERLGRQWGFLCMCVRCRQESEVSSSVDSVAATN